MHYRKLLEAHKIFYDRETRAENYDEYMQNKDWQSWRSPVLPIIEVEKLFDFIRSWDFHFKGDPDKFRQICQEVYPIIEGLAEKRLEDVDLTSEEIKRNIQEIFDKVANCAKIVRFESTDASKILHTIVPNFFVMWDSNIQWGILRGVTLDGSWYAYEFLPLMQRELEEAINTCRVENGLNREEAVRKISEYCDNKTLPKLIDQFN